MADQTQMENDKYSKTTMVEQRVLSFMYAWLYHVEQVDGNPEPFHPLLAEGFALKFSEDNIVDTEAKLEQWVRKAPQMVKNSNHFPENIQVQVLGKNAYQLDVEFIWRGTSINGVSLQAHTVHSWTLVDDPNWPNAKLKTMQVTYKIPFSPLNN